MGRTYLEIDSDTDGLAGVLTRRDAVTISPAFASTQQAAGRHGNAEPQQLRLRRRISTPSINDCHYYSVIIDY